MTRILVLALCAAFAACAGPQGAGRRMTREDLALRPFGAAPTSVYYLEALSGEQERASVLLVHVAATVMLVSGCGMSAGSLETVDENTFRVPELEPQACSAQDRRQSEIIGQMLASGARIEREDHYLHIVAADGRRARFGLLLTPTNPPPPS